MEVGEGSSTKYMDDKLYEAARFSSTDDAVVIPPPTDKEDGLYYLRVTQGDGNNALHVAALHGNHRFVRAILNVPANEAILCERNAKGETPLHLAAQSGSWETVEAILDAHCGDGKLACWKERDREGDTPLHTALRFGHEEIAMRLLVPIDIRCLVSINNNVGESLAYLAAENNCRMFLRNILDADRRGECWVGFSGPFGRTAFHPIRKLTGDILLISIETKKDLLKVQDDKGKTVLHYAVEEERGSIVKILLEEDKTLAYLHDKDGLTPLLIAAIKGFLDIIEMILELCPPSIEMMGELINQVDNDGNTPLHLALMNSDLAIADKLLLVDGINWRLTNKLGYCPMDLCVSDDQIPLKLKRLARECRAKEVLNMKIFFHKNVVNADDALHHYGWDACLAFKGPQGDNILHTAARDGNLKIIERVKESESARSLLLSGRNSKGETPLHLAAEYGYLKVVRFILQQTSSGENINDRDSAVVTIENVTTSTIPPWRNLSNKGDTPAHRAIRNRHAQVALLLLKRDPGLITVKNNAEESLLYLAADNKCYDAIKGILKLGRYDDDSITSGGRGQNFFHAAAKCPRNFSKLYTDLIQNQPNLIKMVDHSGKTPLHYAVEEWRVFMTEWMLKQDKSAAFVYDNEGFTPLLRAAVLGRRRCMMSILNLCPQSAKLRDLRSNRTVLHLAKMPPLLLRNCTKHKEVRKLVNETDKDGNTALHCAILGGDTDKALVLLDTQGINLTIRNKQHKSPKDLCEQRIAAGETHQRPIDLALYTLGMRDSVTPRFFRLDLWVKKILSKYRDLILIDENLNKMLTNIAVAAVLLITITFAAAFTVPGGYDKQGEVLLVNRAAVRVFMASDALAMLMAISILIRYTLGGGSRTKLRKLAMDCIIMLQISLVCTIIAFISGICALGFEYVIIVPCLFAAILNAFFVVSFECLEFRS